MGYIQQLDSIRAIAVLFVLTGHWFPHNLWLYKVPLASLGVDVFFVLSGFLITLILLTNREKAEHDEVRKGKVLKSFYVRRVLRIFPIYYLLIFAVLLAGKVSGTNIKSAFLYYFTYTSNIYYFNIQEWDGILSHTWSLAVEEQFYLIWPFLMLFINRKYLIYVMIGFICIGALSQFFLRGVPMATYLSSSCFDSFGMGGLLAYIRVYKPSYIHTFYQMSRIAAPVAVISFVAVIIQTKWPVFAMTRVIDSVIALFVITYIVYKRDSGTLRFNYLWDNKMLIFLGKISYGLYLYHYVLPHFFFLIIRQHFNVDLEASMNIWLIILIKFLLVVLISWLSWLIIEKPMLRLKEYFNYSGGKSNEKVLLNS